MKDLQKEVEIHFQKSCGADYPIETILDNLCADEITEDIVEYGKTQRGRMIPVEESIPEAILKRGCCLSPCRNMFLRLQTVNDVHVVSGERLISDVGEEGWYQSVSNVGYAKINEEGDGMKVTHWLMIQTI